MGNCDFRVKTGCNCLLQIFSLSRVSVFKIPFSLIAVIPNASFLRNLTNENFFTFYFFPSALGICAIRLKREGIGNMFPKCISNALLNMCSDPFVMVLNVRAACLVSTKLKSVSV